MISIQLTPGKIIIGRVTWGESIITQGKDKVTQGKLTWVDIYTFGKVTHCRHARGKFD